MLLSRPSKDGFARLDGRLGKIARLTPVFLQFCPSFCDLVHVQSVSELLSKVNYVATRLRHLETIRWHVEWKLPPNELSPKIVLIYALLLLKCRESYLRAFLIHNLNFARLFARLTPVFLLKKRPSFARLFTKMSPSEEVVTLVLFSDIKLILVVSICWSHSGSSWSDNLQEWAWWYCWSLPQADQL